MSDLIPFPSDFTPTRIEVFYLNEEEPWICGIHGHCGGDMIEVIEKDLAEEPWRYFDKGQGTYLFEAVWISAQMGEEGRVELPGYWDLSLLRFKSIEEN